VHIYRLSIISSSSPCPFIAEQPKLDDFLNIMFSFELISFADYSFVEFYHSSQYYISRSRISFARVIVSFCSIFNAYATSL